MLSIKRAFKHLFDRLTSDMAPHNQVRLILNSHQLDRPISLPFLPRDRLTPERCLTQIKNNDELCYARAIVVAKAKLDKDPQYTSIVSHRGTLQARLAHDLHEQAGVPLSPSGIEEIKKFQAVLPGYQLNVVSKEHLNIMIYSGPETDKCLYLYHHDNYYDVITSMPAFLARKQYCHKCKKGYDKITDHPVAISEN